MLPCSLQDLAVLLPALESVDVDARDFSLLLHSKLVRLVFSGLLVCVGAIGIHMSTSGRPRHNLISMVCGYGTFGA